MALLCHTKDGSKPYGKPKVFFTSHSQDWDTFFLPVCEELFRFCDCAVYYEDPAEPTRRDTEYYIRLKRMNLLVIPVTDAFLCQSNPALDLDLSYAMEHHIPILPLIQEPGLDKLFAKKFGNLQYLDKTARSATAIPYEEKLQQFLESVLLGSELTERIRSHFDGYIFLSYRKKDRRYIQAMMRLIHQFPQFRDIGLWYDEYLTPGEDFNNEIAQHLNKSQLFALIVTPNLVNEDNYVKAHEYPMARSNLKPILPVQFEQTDADALRSGYPEIPECLDPEDAAVLEAALEHSLAGLTRRHNDADSVHCYHIGLAYLTGTDVEVDHRRALTLITQAAEAGLDDAIGKLVHMYHIGDGVAPDQDKAVFWVQKLADAAQEQYLRHRDQKTAERYYYRLKYAAGICDLGWHTKQAEAFAMQLVSFAEEMCDSEVFHPRLLAEAYETLANTYALQGYNNEAAEQLYAAYEIRQELCKDPNKVSVKSLRELIQCCQDLGDICKELQDLPLAETYYRQAIEYLEGIRKSAVDLPHRTRLARLHQRLGDIFDLRNNSNEARKEYLAALELAKSIAVDSGDDRILISHYHSLAELEDHQTPLTSGRRYWKEALKIAQARDDRNRTDQTQDDLARCHLRLGASYYINWILRLRNVIRFRSKSHLDKALAIYRELDRKQNSDMSKVWLHLALSGLGELHCKMDFFREAEPYYLEALALSEQILKSADTPDNRIRTAQDCGSLSEIYKELKQPGKAIRYARRRFDLMDNMVEEINTCETWDELAQASYDLAILTRSGQKMAYAAEIWHALAQEYPDIPRFAQLEKEAWEWLPKS